MLSSLIPFPFPTALPLTINVNLSYQNDMDIITLMASNIIRDSVGEWHEWERIETYEREVLELKNYQNGQQKPYNEIKFWAFICFGGEKTFGDWKWSFQKISFRICQASLVKKLLYLNSSWRKREKCRFDIMKTWFVMRDGKCAHIFLHF